MDYEKAYKAVLETATKWIEDGCTDKEKICLESVFPELRESEDERIRKWLVDYFKAVERCWIHWDISPERIVSYLEKKKEPENVSATTMAPSCWEVEQKEQKLPITGNDFGWIDELKHDLEHPEELDQKVDDVLKKRQKPVERSLEDDHIIGFIYDLLNEIEWKDNWAMSKEECLERLKSLRPQIIDSTTLYTIEQVNEKIREAQEWKPSEEQMQALMDTLEFMPDAFKPRCTLVTLQNDLEKLI